MTTPYVELRAHSSFSFGDGSASPEQLIAAAASMGYAALGLTDHADVGGIIRFALEATKQGLRPIAGAELSVGGRPIAVLARDARGFRNLCALVTRARLGVWGSRDEDDGAGWGVPSGLGDAAQS